jgi:hypothetical protein
MQVFSFKRRRIFLYIQGVSAYLQSKQSRVKVSKWTGINSIDEPRLRAPWSVPYGRLVLERPEVESVNENIFNKFVEQYIICVLLDFVQIRKSSDKINISFSRNFGRSIELLFLENEYENFIFALSQKVYSTQGKIYHFHEKFDHIFGHIVRSNFQALRNENSLCIERTVFWTFSQSAQFSGHISFRENRQKNQCCGSGYICFRASRIRLRILRSSSKNSKKNIDSYCFVPSV